MYRISFKQLLLIVVVSAVVSGIIVACAERSLKKLEPISNTIEPTAIADPTVATDEQNNIEVYRAVSPGVVFITSTQQVQTFYGVYPQKGSGSGSVIDKEGHILTNYHVIENADQLEVTI